jgi:hypothetical protein
VSGRHRVELPRHPVVTRQAALRIAAGLVVAAVCATLLAAAGSPAPPTNLVLGTYKFGACVECNPGTGPDGVDAYARWLGSDRLVYAEDNVGDTYWEYFETGWPDSFRQWSDWRTKDPSRRLVLAVPLFVSEEPSSNREKIAACARGDYDAHYAALSRNLRAANLGDSILRIGWEAHANWQPWSYRNNPTDWRACWRRIASTVKREVPTLRANWNVGDDVGGTRTYMRDSVAIAGFDAFYPGNDVVDEIGIDTYDTPRIKNYSAFFNDDVGNLGWFVLQAKRLGKPLSFPEWGLWDSQALDRSDGSGDDPDFIARMYAWMTDPDHHVAWAAYFDANVDATANHQLQPDWQDGTRFPRASEQFRQLFGAL